LDGDDVRHHIFCGKNLQFIYDNPTEHCVGSSTPWTNALVNREYDQVVVQPYLGTTQAQDVEVISAWMQLQPDAEFIVNTAWAPHASFEDDFLAGNAVGVFNHSKAYFDDLVQQLRELHPERTISSTRTNEVFYSVLQDTLDGVGPLDQLSDLYRDDIHLTTDGRYLAHNALRQALGQPFSNSFTNISDDQREYFDSKINAFLPVQAVPEPGSLVLFPLIGILTAVRRNRVW
jgi:hypothetical protein